MTAGASGHPVQKSFLRFFGSVKTLLRFGSRVERCSGGQRGRRGRAAAEASAEGAAGADAQPADPPAAARDPSCNGKGCKTKSVIIGMNALIDLEYAAGTL